MKLASRIPDMAKAAMFVALLAQLPAGAGCSGYRLCNRSIGASMSDTSAGWEDSFEIGASVRVHTTSGSVVAGKVESLGPSEVRVCGEPIQFSEIESLEARSFLWEPTAVIVGAIAWTFWLVTRSPGVFSPDAK